MNENKNATRLARLVLVPLVGIGVAGCGGPPDGGIATAGGVTGPSPTASGPPPATGHAQRQRQYTECLRRHGVEIADPDQEKAAELTRPEQPGAKEAAQACQQYAPAIAGTKGDADITRLRRYVSCLRQNGVGDLPDPDPDAVLLIPKSILSSPEFEAADRVCAAETGKTDPSGTR
jgi:hypothetical protein